MKVGSRLLVLDDEVQAQVDKLKKEAQDNFLTTEQLIQMRDEGASIGDTQFIEIPVGFRVVYSVEQHPAKGGDRVWLNHISVSVSNEAFPHPTALDEICKLFGWKEDDPREIWPENENDNTMPSAVNIVWKILPIDS